ncbi:MAG: TlpA disulfide reductase family protein [Sedimentisphaerales bacterium]
MIRTKFVIWFGLIALIAALFVGCKDKPQSATPEPNSVTKPQNNIDVNASVNAAPNPAVSQPTKANTAPKPTIENIVARRWGWNPAYINWYGKMAPDFTVTDITGKSHTLSQYKGKTVLLIFWATWCGPCRQEIPSFIEIRKNISEDKLAMLAISYIDFRSSTEGVKKFVAANPIINYTIITAEPDALPSPYNSIYSIPTTFFINPDGTIKFVTEGLTPLPHIKAILDAEQ